MIPPPKDAHEYIVLTYTLLERLEQSRTLWLTSATLSEVDLDSCSWSLAWGRNVVGSLQGVRTLQQCLSFKHEDLPFLAALGPLCGVNFRSLCLRARLKNASAADYYLVREYARYKLEGN